MNNPLDEIRGLLEPVADQDWHGKWRIKKALELCSKESKMDNSKIVAENCFRWLWEKGREWEYCLSAAINAYDEERLTPCCVANDALRNKHSFKIPAELYGINENTSLTAFMPDKPTQNMVRDGHSESCNLPDGHEHACDGVFIKISTKTLGDNHG